MIDQEGIEELEDDQASTFDNGVFRREVEGVQALHWLSLRSIVSLLLYAMTSCIFVQHEANLVEDDGAAAIARDDA